jgi:hypothetical protein
MIHHTPIIKLFIVTWQNERALNNGLQSLFKHAHLPLEVNVIANHSSVKIHDKFEDRVTVLLNNLRLDESTGYLSRNWNQAILLGIKDLNNPACDVLVTAQDDTIYHKDWLKKLLSLHARYSFITYGWGDTFCSYLPRAIKRVGLWDERFITMFHAADYFYRMLLFNKAESSINDYCHKRVLNPENVKIASRPNNKTHDYFEGLRTCHSFNKRLFFQKYPLFKMGAGPSWNKALIDNPEILIADNYILYPYFEKDVETLEEQNYLT